MRTNTSDQCTGRIFQLEYIVSSTCVCVCDVTNSTDSSRESDRFLWLREIKIFSIHINQLIDECNRSRSTNFVEEIISMKSPDIQQRRTGRVSHSKVWSIQYTHLPTHCLSPSLFLSIHAHGPPHAHTQRHVPNVARRC